MMEDGSVGMQNSLGKAGGTRRVKNAGICIRRNGRVRFAVVRLPVYRIGVDHRYPARRQFPGKIHGGLVGQNNRRLRVL